MTSKFRRVLFAAVAEVTLASRALGQPDPGPTTGSASNQSERMLGSYATDSGSRKGQVSVWAGANVYAHGQRNP
jgi:hypothetical protein